MALAPDARRSLPLSLFLISASSLLALFAARSLSASPTAFLLVCGAILRFTLLFRAPDVSDDVFRYAWDARVSAAGYSPYALPPDDHSLDGVAPALRRRVAHADLRTVYPPVAQAAFRAAGSLPGVFPLKVLFAAADLCIVWLITRLGGPASGYAGALYAFHPLPLTESAAQGHLDALGVALLLASLLAVLRRRPLASGTTFALSVLAKYVPLSAVIPFGRAGRWKFAAAAAAAAGAIWLAASRGGAAPSAGLSEYASRWEFNSIAYPAVRSAIDATQLPSRAKQIFIEAKARMGHPRWTQSVFPLFYSGFMARAALAVVLAGALATIGWRVRDTETAVFASLAAVLLLSPTLHPWYLLWVLPFAARRRNSAFLYLSFAAPISYALLYPVPGLPTKLVYAIEYVPFGALLVWPAVRRRGA
jgi:hypothetical protein